MKDIERKSILYLSYDGMTDALGQSQVLSYLSHLAVDYKVHLISFEKPEKLTSLERVISNICSTHNINWIKAKYNKTPPIVSTLKDIKTMAKLAAKTVEQHNISIIHCRGYLPGLVGLKLKNKFNVKFLFDMRGWWADEKKDAGDWASNLYSPVYRYFKRLEKRLFAKADYVVSLTESGKDEIVKLGFQQNEKIGVIPTCVNFDVFKPFDQGIRQAVRNELNIDQDAKVLVYSGALGGNYDISIPMKVYRAFKAKYGKTNFLILSKTAPSILEDYVVRNNINKESIRLRSVAYSDVHKYLMAADLGFVFYKDGYSNIGRSPTKLGEYWASGLPVLSTSGIGDVKNILASVPGGGEVLTSLEDENILEGFDTIKWDLDKSALRKHSLAYYSLDRGVHFYRNIYNNLT